jgi:glycerophosphoryl diester phosphodiesterase
MLIIGHRGASGYRPEHTLASYRLAAEMGADYIEPDLVSTRDGVLVARHENEISGTTDVAAHSEFAGRRTTKTIDGAAVSGWFTEDFTLAELKTLRARERIPDLRPANAEYDGRFDVPTFEEVLELRAQLSAELGRAVGVYPETKHPSHFRGEGLALEPPLVRAIAAHGLDGADAPVFVQSFERGSLQAVRRELSVPLVQLLGARSAAAADLADVARYADAVGPAKDHIVRHPGFVADAHAAGLLVHPYTFRRENAFLPAELRSSDDPAAPGDLAAELERFLVLGVDGVFTDNADVAAAVAAGG